MHVYVLQSNKLFVYLWIANVDTFLETREKGSQLCVGIADLKKMKDEAQRKIEAHKWYTT